MSPTAAGTPWLGMLVFPDHRRLKARKVRHASRHFRARYEAYQSGEISFGVRRLGARLDRPCGARRQLGPAPPHAGAIRAPARTRQSGAGVGRNDGGNSGQGKNGGQLRGAQGSALQRSSVQRRRGQRFDGGTTTHPKADVDATDVGREAVAEAARQTPDR